MGAGGGFEMARRSVITPTFSRLLLPKSGLLCSFAISAIVMVAAQMVGLINLASVRSISLTIFGIGFIIFVHELGHFLVAKACGVKCEKFYLGFDVNGLKLAKFQWGETEYGIGAVPLGGYVKMLGQDDNVANADAEAERTKVRNEDGTVTLNPRSYTAKSVPQRMAIISAGVIMNLIFAVIFASIAFTQGVEYEPCVVGALAGGGTAWKAGIEPGDRIIQFGKSGTPSPHLRFNSDLMENVYLHDPQIDLDLLVEKPDGEQYWVATRPERVFAGKTIFGDEFRPRLGVALARSLELLAPVTLQEEDLTPETKWFEKIRLGDRIVAANGEPLANAVSLAVLEVKLADSPITLTIERTLDEKNKKLAQPERYEVVLPPQKRRELGIQFKAAGITIVLKNSVAEAAGIREGDIISKINGEAVSDPTLLPMTFTQLGGKETKLTLIRGEKTKEELEVTLTPAELTRPIDAFPSSQVAIDGLGVCFPVESVVASVSEAVAKQKFDVKEGDRVTAYRLEYEDEDGKPDLDKWIELRDEEPNGDWLVYLANRLKLKALHLRLQRGVKEHEVRMTPFVGDAYSADRNIPVQSAREIRQTSSPLEALTLGLRETKESGFKVLTFLKKLVTGGVSPTKLGGPISIAYVANQQASLGLSRFLLFLTLISANLAIVNFLPIPVLDGGHMMFLTAEAIRGKPVSEKFQIWLSMAGLFFVMSLMLFVISLDVLRFSGVNV
jgi:regulator of sigma E protease